MIGRRELLEIRKEDLDDDRVIDRIENRSSLVFVSFRELLQLQSDSGAINMAKKRSKKTTSGVSLSLDTESLSFIQTSLGICTIHEWNTHRRSASTTGSPLSCSPDFDPST